MSNQTIPLVVMDYLTIAIYFVFVLGMDWMLSKTISSRRRMSSPLGRTSGCNGNIYTYRDDFARTI